MLDARWLDARCTTQVVHRLSEVNRNSFEVSLLISSGIGRVLSVVLALLVLIASPSPPSNAQAVNAASPNTTLQDTALNLPDAPGSLSRVVFERPGTTSNFTESIYPVLQISSGPAPQRVRQAGRFELKIAPDEIAPPMTASSKILAGFKGSVSPLSPVAWLAAAGWSHLIDGKPNFGTDSGAFGERLGASTIRDIGESIFTNSIFAPVFHEDPRYYQLGRGHSIVRRAVYAATRAIVTRTDDGRATPNFSLLAGDVAGAALTTTYYPPQNTSFGEAFETFSGSVGGSALGFVVTEFLDDALQLAHLKKPE